MKIKLRISKTNGALISEHEVSLNKPLILGRKAPAGLIINDVTVSGGHVELSADGAGVRVRDLRSQNGTFQPAIKPPNKTLKPPFVINLGGMIDVEVSAGSAIADDTQTNRHVSTKEFPWLEP